MITGLLKLEMETFQLRVRILSNQKLSNRVMHELTYIFVFINANLSHNDSRVESASKDLINTECEAGANELRDRR
jgi:hypothetical protein